MLNYFNFDNGSVIIPDTSEIIADVQQEFVSVFGANLNLDPSTPQGRLIELEANSRKNFLEIIAMLFNLINPYYATGQALDAIGALFGRKRKAATPTIVLCYLNGEPNTVIPADSQAKTTAGDVFYTPNNITLDANGEATAYFYSFANGAIPCELNTLNEIVTQIVGWESINNPASAIIGTDTESDVNFRQRILNSRYSGVALLDAVKSKLKNIDGVLGFAIYNNYENEPVTWENVVTVPAHSIALIIQGGDDAEIAQALFDAVTIGCGYTTIENQSVTVNIPYNASNFTINYPITFNRPEVVDIACKVQINTNQYAGSDLTADVKNALLNWSNNQVLNVEGMQIGKTIYTYEIGAALSAEIPEIIVRNVEISTVGGTLSNSPITLDITQIGTLTADNITVEII